MPARFHRLYTVMRNLGIAFAITVAGAVLWGFLLNTLHKLGVITGADGFWYFSVFFAVAFAVIPVAAMVMGIVRPVRDPDVAFLQRTEQLVLLLAVVVLRLAEDAEVRKPVRDVRDHVDLHCGLPLPVLRPVDAPERKLDGGRVGGVDAAPRI